MKLLFFHIIKQITFVKLLLKTLNITNNKKYKNKYLKNEKILIKYYFLIKKLMICCQNYRF